MSGVEKSGYLNILVNKIYTRNPHSAIARFACMATKIQEKQKGNSKRAHKQLDLLEHGTHTQPVEARVSE